MTRRHGQPNTAQCTAGSRGQHSWRPPRIHGVLENAAALRRFGFNKCRSPRSRLPPPTAHAAAAIHLAAAAHNAYLADRAAAFFCSTRRCQFACAQRKRSRAHARSAGISLDDSRFAAQTHPLCPPGSLRRVLAFELLRNATRIEQGSRLALPLSYRWESRAGSSCRCCI